MIPNIKSPSEQLAILRSHDPSATTQHTFLPFFGHHTSPDGRITASCLSQFYSIHFKLDGINYPSAEHAMMAAKARLFNDHKTFNQIVKTATPAKAKALGRKVKGYVEKEWDAARYNIVVRNNLAKFSQHSNLGEFLLSTGESVLVEASPWDTIWGIGFRYDSPFVRSPREWKGQNLLGFALMEVRERLRYEKRENFEENSRDKL
ncbi:DUF1768-domain-containing protein [Gonapodya prolifera JEL478]|uniref:DUF1768-domain-containing protein n=1 Tax=Gonapodya prolifera (strain JEL478) TaxID=1344416 RepID=A0A139AF49_GONPJ|nr:DUF1768-domain-containing protein [Gonapodya prolifera JEL478]|eukprot:KXS15194.1 DUF1768-domain-containing protein [Gonapodya prolifera JEL478]